MKTELRDSSETRVDPSETRAHVDATWSELCEGGRPADLAETSPPAPRAVPADVFDAAKRSSRVPGVLLPGAKFGAYVIAECIGEGGMARIYRAEHEGLRRQVALKVLTGSFARDPEGWERFVREGRIAAAVKHPNVVNIFDVGVHEGVPYLVMELLEGTDLESLVQEKGGLEEGLILDIMVPVVAGLAAVHDSGIVHRDLKPGNIFLSKGRYDDIEPKLLDFGISKANGPDQLKLTTRGLLIGTPFYMAPEGFRGEDMTPRSDQYSLGVVMYECATGRSPFVAETLPDLVRAVTNGEVRPIEQDMPGVSSRLRAIIERCISLDPANRYADLRELGRELLKLAGQRTRITWGLSFGEPNTALPVAPTNLDPGAAPQQSLSPSAASVTPIPFLRGGTRAPLWLLGAVGFMVFALVLHLSSDLLEPSSESAPANAAVSINVGPMPDHRIDVQPLRAEAIEAPPAVPDQAAKTKAKPSQSRAAMGRSPAESAAVRLPRGDDTPDWVFPGSTARASASESRAMKAQGTNGAPILD